MELQSSANNNEKTIDTRSAAQPPRASASSGAALSPSQIINAAIERFCVNDYMFRAIKSTSETALAVEAETAALAFRVDFASELRRLQKPASV